MGLHQRRHHAAPGRHGAEGAGASRARPAGGDRRRRDVRESRAAGAVRGRDCRRRGRDARARPGDGAARRPEPRRAGRAPGDVPRLLRSVALRSPLQERRDDRRLRTTAGERRTSGRQEGRGQERGSARSARDLDLHARHRVRIALPHRGGARVREPVPVLLGRVQLSAGAGVSRRPHPGAGGGRASVRQSRRPRVDRALRPSRDRQDSRRPARARLLHQPRLSPPR